MICQVVPVAVPVGADVHRPESTIAAFTAIARAISQNKLFWVRCPFRPDWAIVSRFTALQHRMKLAACSLRSLKHDLSKTVRV